MGLSAPLAPNGTGVAESDKRVNMLSYFGTEIVWPVRLYAFFGHRVYMYAETGDIVSNRSDLRDIGRA